MDIEALNKELQSFQKSHHGQNPIARVFLQDDPYPVFWQLTSITLPSTRSLFPGGSALNGVMLYFHYGTDVKGHSPSEFKSIEILPTETIATILNECSNLCTSSHETVSDQAETIRMVLTGEIQPPDVSQTHVVFNSKWVAVLNRMMDAVSRIKKEEEAFKRAILKAFSFSD